VGSSPAIADEGSVSAGDGYGVVKKEDGISTSAAIRALEIGEAISGNGEVVEADEAVKDSDKINKAG